MKLVIIFPIVAALLISSCVKKIPPPSSESVENVNIPLTEGFPDNTDSINGYCFFSTTTLLDSRVFAYFSDPKTDLMTCVNHLSYNESQRLGNLSVGKVLCNDILLGNHQKGLNLAYGGASYNTTYTNITWSIEGNRTFKGFSAVLKRGVPKIELDLFPKEIDRSKALILNLDQITPEFDSVIVEIIGTPRLLKKLVSRPQSLVVFTKSEINGVLPSGNYCSIVLHAYNYSYCTLNNKNYIFECANHLNQSVSIYE